MAKYVVRLPFVRKRPLDKAPSDALDVLLADAKKGNKEARETLLRSYQPFVDRVVAQVCGRAISHTEDEFQIAFVAMNDAIDRYEDERGSFIGFAETVMRRRLIDHFRVNERQKERPFSAFEVEDEEGNLQNTVDVDASMAIYEADELVKARAEEIERYKEELSLYGVSFDSLMTLSPKHQDARMSAIAVARTLAKDPLLSQTFVSSHVLPMKQLQNRVMVSRKTLERQRHYIVAVTVLLLGDYELLQGFVREGDQR